MYFGDAVETRQWAREVNEYRAEVVAGRPERFGFFATLTLPDVEGALAEARYALDTLLADGIVLLANNDGRYLGDPGFEPLLEFLHHRRAVVFIHSGELPAPAVPGIPAFAADFLLDTTRTALSLILSGAMEKYSGIKFILAHAGGFVPYIAYRILLTMLNNRELALSALAALTDKEQSVLRRFYYDVALSASPRRCPACSRWPILAASHTALTSVCAGAGDRFPEHAVRALPDGPLLARVDRPRQCRGAVSPPQACTRLSRVW